MFNTKSNRNRGFPRSDHFGHWELLLCFGIFLLASCSGPRDEEMKTVRFMVLGDPAGRDAYIELVDAFHQEHPEIDIEMTHIPSPRDYRTRLATEYAAGSPPDISLMNYRRFANFAARDLLEPLGQYLEESDDIDTSDFYPVTTEAFTWQGELMCIPQNISSLVVYYNADLFDEAGREYPSDSWT